MVLASFPGQSTVEKAVKPPIEGPFLSCFVKFTEELTFIEFAFFPDVERAHRTVIAHDTCPDFTAGSLVIWRYGTFVRVCLVRIVCHDGILLR